MTNVSSTQPLRQILAWGLPASITLSYLIPGLQSDLRSSFPALIGITSLIMALIGVTLYAGTRGLIDWSPEVIILVSVILRIIFLFTPPQLSDDIYRYLWDGLQVLNGQNPYSAAPLKARLPNDAAYNLLQLMNHPDLGTIYPPAAQVIFAAGAYLGAGFLGFKALLVLMDSISCVLIVKLLSRAGLPAWQAVVYAWHPLPILEIASSGHIDGAGILFLFLTLALLQALSPERSTREDPSRRPESRPRRHIFIAMSAGFTFACAVLVKLFPLIFLPGMFILAGKRFRAPFLAGIAAGVFTLTIPFLPDIKNAFSVLNTYILNWEFAGFAFRTLRRITSSGYSARLILASFFIIFAAVRYRKLLLEVRHTVQYSDRDRCLPSPGDGRFLAVMETFCHITMAFLFLTPTLHPWYALYLVCFLPFAPEVAGLMLTWSVLLSYRVLVTKALLGQWIEDDFTPLLIWSAPVCAWILAALAGKLKRQLAFILNSHLMW
jgi:hypothetical protein